MVKFPKHVRKFGMDVWHPLIKLFPSDLWNMDLPDPVSVELTVTSHFATFATLAKLATVVKLAMVVKTNMAAPIDVNISEDSGKHLEFFDVGN